MPVNSYREEGPLTEYNVPIALRKELVSKKIHGSVLTHPNAEEVFYSVWLFDRKAKCLRGVKRSIKVCV